MNRSDPYPQTSVVSLLGPVWRGNMGSLVDLRYPMEKETDNTSLAGCPLPLLPFSFTF